VWGLEFSLPGRLTLEAARRAAEPIVLEEAAEASDDVTRLLFTRDHPADPVWTEDAIGLLEEAGRVARGAGQKAYGTSHVVAALDAAPAPAAHRLLTGLGLN
jgi:hypothetical protein